MQTTISDKKYTIFFYEIVFIDHSFHFHESRNLAIFNACRVAKKKWRQFFIVFKMWSYSRYITNTLSHCPISETSALLKVLYSILNLNVRIHFNYSNFISDDHYDFRKKSSTGDLLSLFLWILVLCSSEYQWISFYNTDIPKVFDRIWYNPQGIYSIGSFYFLLMILYAELNNIYLRLFQ